MWHTWPVSRLRRDVHVVVHVLAPPVPRWSKPLDTRRAEHISFRIAVIVTAVEHCDSRGSFSYAAAPNQCVRAVARWFRFPVYVRFDLPSARTPPLVVYRARRASSLLSALVHMQR